MGRLASPILMRELLLPPHGPAEMYMSHVQNHHNITIKYVISTLYTQ